MKKAALVLIILAIVTMILVTTSLRIKTVKAESEDDDYIIEHVNHTIEVMYNGYIFINDTIQIVGRAATGKTLNRFLVGFPQDQNNKYGAYVLQCTAYDAFGMFNTTLNVPLGHRMGFYAAEINFSSPLDISNNASHVFSVVFVLSHDLLTQNALNASRFKLDVPAYPSLTKDTNCSVTIALPEGAADVTIAKEDGTVTESTFVKVNLPAFTSSPANVTFSLTSGGIQLVDIKELKSEVRITGISEVEVSDSYYVASRAIEDISSIEIILPSNALDLSVQDQFGRTMTKPAVTDEETNHYTITFTSVLESYRSTRFTVKYRLPGNYTMQIGMNNFNFSFPLFQHVNYYIEWASIAFVLPEGARISSFDTTLIGGTYSIARSIFQETLIINRGNITYLESILPSENVLRIEYEYNPLWSSFRPTLWIWALAVVGCVIVVAWRRPKISARVVAPTAVVKLRPEYIKSFIEAYEEKRKIILELESLENRVRKGKIPRRRYKVQRKTLETRVSSLSRNLTESKDRMRAAGGQYVDLMRQLEIAETEINEIEANIKSIEAHHKRGELSLEAHRKLLTDYQRRKEKADTTINGIILRLREETH
jgi:hypothetical protein